MKLGAPERRLVSSCSLHPKTALHSCFHHVPHRFPPVLLALPAHALLEKQPLCMA